MPTFTPGVNLRLADGTMVRVGRLLGAGGQGEVYSVALPDGSVKALKWYTLPNLYNKDGFYRSMQHRCEWPPPSAAFLWPERLTERHPSGAFGYVMKLKADGFIGLGDYFCVDRHPEAWFRSNMAKVNAALNIADCFNRLHMSGCCYQDINEGSFFIDPYTGQVELCDNDNVIVDGYGTGLVGKPRYIAPEVLDGGIPTTNSDRFAMAIVLYRIFMVDHPFEGARSAAMANTGRVSEDEIFGHGAVFCHDYEDDSNRPVPALHPNSAYYWEQMPRALRDAFATAFSRRALEDPASRLSAARWKALLASVRAAMLTCKADPAAPLHDYFAEAEAPAVCPRCGKAAAPFAELRFDSGTVYRLMPGKELYLDDGTVVHGRGIAVNQAGVGQVPAVLNETRDNWICGTDPDTALVIEPGSSIVAGEGRVVDFGRGRRATMHYTPPKSASKLRR